LNILKDLEKEYSRKMELELRNNQVRGINKIIKEVMGELFNKLVEMWSEECNRNKEK
jgi:hypothetical protein